jgi:hypothetical protein
MSTRMQQRRGTAAQWISTNSGNGPILAAGEIGFESDTNKFKIGDGINHWVDLVYFTDAESAISGINNLIDGAPSALDTLNELAAALGDDANYAATITTALGTKAPLDDPTFTGTVDVSGAQITGVVNPVGDTDAVNKAYMISTGNSAITAHNETTVNVHGISDTSDLVYADDVRLSDERTPVDNSVSTAKIQDAAITDVQIATSAVTTNKINDDAVTAIKIADANVTEAKINNGAVTADKIGTSAVTEGKIANDAVTATKIKSGEITDSHISTIAAIAQSKVDGLVDALASKASASDLSTHESDTTLVHGITDTSLLVTTTGTQTLSNKTLSSPTITVSSGYTVVGTETGFEVSTYPVSAGVTGINFYKYPFPNSAGVQVGDTVQAYKSGETEINSKVWTVVNIDTVFGSLDATINETYSYNNDGFGNTGFELKKVTGSSATISATEISYLDGVTSNIQTQIDAKAALSGATFTGDVTVETNLTVDGDLTVTGTTTTVSASDLVVSDPLIYLGDGNTGNLVDLGFVANFNDGTYQHTGLVRDSSAGAWKLFKGVTDEPTTTVNFGQGSLDDIQVAALAATTVTPSSGIVFSDGTQVKAGVPSITTFATAISSSATLATGEADKFVPLTGAVTITLPATGYSKGQSIDFYQESGTGAEFASTNGVVGTPGLKFRTTNSVATAMKTENGWLVFGDLSA